MADVYFDDSDVVGDFSFYGHRHEPPENDLVRQIARLQVVSAASVLHTGGQPALNAMMADWPEADKNIFCLTCRDGRYGRKDISALSGEEPKLYSSEIVTWVTAPDKENYRVSYDIEGLRAANLANAPDKHRREILNVPIPMIWMGVLGGLFSVRY